MSHQLEKNANHKAGLEKLFKDPLLETKVIMDLQKHSYYLPAIGAVSGALAVMIGAFGAHGLKGLLAARQITDRQFAAFETGADYHLIHALLLVVIGLQAAGRWRLPAAIAAILGIVFFSGSLYIYGLTGSPLAAMITPLGGLFYIATWLSLALYFLRKTP